jgi:hypothetical protein
MTKNKIGPLSSGGNLSPGVKKIRSPKHNWLAIKRDFISDITSTYTSLAKKYGVQYATVATKGGREKWPLLREEIQRKAELSLVDDVQSEILEVKKRHIRIAKIMQKLGLEALEKIEYKPKNSKQALEYLVEGIKIEKQTMGLDQNKPVPAIVNIIGKEKEIIGKYETIEDIKVVEV